MEVEAPKEIRVKLDDMHDYDYYRKYFKTLSLKDIWKYLQQETQSLKPSSFAFPSEESSNKL